MVKLWFENLPDRERQIVIYALVALAVIILLWFHLGIKDNLEVEEKRLLAAMNNKAWVNQAVSTIKKQGNGASRLSNKSLAQLSDLVSNRVGIRASRFQPSGENEGQVWFEEIPFTKVLEYSSRLEQDFAVRIDSVAITAAKQTGLVNLRLKLAK